MRRRSDAELRGLKGDVGDPVCEYRPGPEAIGLPGAVRLRDGGGTRLAESRA